MSMIGNLRAASDDEIAALRAEPASIEDFLFGPDPDEEEFQGRLVARGDLEYLDKAWHGLHYLLTGSAWDGSPPLDFLVAGEPIGEEEIGYEPPRAHSSQAVAAIAEALEPIDREVLRARFDPARMLELKIYPEIWDRDPSDDDTLGYLLEYFDSLKAFVSRAASRRLCLIVWID